MVRKARVGLARNNAAQQHKKTASRVARQIAVGKGEMEQTHTRSSAQVIEEILAGLSWYG